MISSYKKYKPSITVSALKAPLQLRCYDQIFTNFLLYYGFITRSCHLKNAGNGKSISKIPLWLSLRPLCLYHTLSFRKTLEDIYGNVAGEEGQALQQLFSIQIFYVFINQISFFDARLLFLTRLFPFLAFFKLHP